MKSAKRFAWLGFGYGFIGAVLFYDSSFSVPTYESHFVCPWCPYITIGVSSGHPLMTLGMAMGIMNGTILAVVCFCVGLLKDRLGPD